MSTNSCGKFHRELGFGRHVPRVSQIGKIRIEATEAVHPAVVAQASEVGAFDICANDACWYDNEQGETHVSYR